jgi:hypothetical protein
MMSVSRLVVGGLMVGMTALSLASHAEAQPQPPQLKVPAPAPNPLPAPNVKNVLPSSSCWNGVLNRDDVADRNQSLALKFAKDTYLDGSDAAPQILDALDAVPPLLQAFVLQTIWGNLIAAKRLSWYEPAEASVCKVPNDPGCQAARGDAAIERKRWETFHGMLIANADRIIKDLDNAAGNAKKDHVIKALKETKEGMLSEVKEFITCSMETRKQLAAVPAPTGDLPAINFPSVQIDIGGSFEAKLDVNPNNTFIATPNFGVAAGTFDITNKQNVKARLKDAILIFGNGNSAESKTLSVSLGPNDFADQAKGPRPLTPVKRNFGTVRGSGKMEVIVDGKSFQLETASFEMSGQRIAGRAHSNTIARTIDVDFGIGNNDFSVNGFYRGKGNQFEGIPNAPVEWRVGAPTLKLEIKNQKVIGTVDAGKIEIQTKAKNPQGNPFNRFEYDPGPVVVGGDNNVTFKLRDFPPPPDPAKGSRDACEQAAGKLPPGRPRDDAREGCRRSHPPPPPNPPVPPTVTVKVDVVVK